MTAAHVIDCMGLRLYLARPEVRLVLRLTRRTRTCRGSQSTNLASKKPMPSNRRARQDVGCNGTHRGSLMFSCPHLVRWFTELRFGAGWRSELHHCVAFVHHLGLERGRGLVVAAGRCSTANLQAMNKQGTLEFHETRPSLSEESAVD